MVHAKLYNFLWAMEVHLETKGVAHITLQEKNRYNIWGAAESGYKLDKIFLTISFNKANLL